MTLKPTNDPIGVMRREAGADRRATQAALDAGGTQPEQVVRKLRQQVQQLEAVVASMQELFNRMPQNDGRQANASGWSIDTAPVGGAWTTVATATIPRPVNMNRAAVMAVATAAAATGSAYPFAMQGRILINGVASAEREGTLEYLANVARSSLNMGFFYELSGLSVANVTVQLQLRGRFADFPASNVAGLSVSIGYTRVG